MPSLFVIQGRDQGRRFELTAEELTIGRDGSNTIQLHDTEVSRQHALLRAESFPSDSHAGLDGGYVLVDLQSSNGSFVNSQPIQERRLQSGDRVQLGRTLMLFTGHEGRPAEDLSEVVQIVGRESSRDSRIVRTMGQAESEEFGEAAEAAEGAWLARARSNLQVMYRTALAVSHTLDIDQLLDRIMELIFEWVEADRGCIMLLNQQTEELVPKARRTRDRSPEDGPASVPASGSPASRRPASGRPGSAESPIHISRTILDYVMEHNEGVLTSDARDDRRWDAGGSIVKLGVREAICVPMQGRYGVVGVIYIDTFTPPGRVMQQKPSGRPFSGRPQQAGARGAGAQGAPAQGAQLAGSRFSEEHLKLMVAIGHQAALAVEDTSYYSAMVQAERLAAVGQTIAMLSHHIKNILQGIRGGSYLIEEGLDAGESDLVRKGWRIVERNQERISHLVMDMLTFSKEREPDLAPADLNEVAADVVQLMQTRASEAGVELSWHPDTDMPLLTFDFEAVHRAVLNVVINAIDACAGAEEGKVEVRSEYLPDRSIAVVQVKDNGSGIPAEDIKKIFAVFESGKGARGTGLGLPVSQKILREHGGEIRVESKLGQGSRFLLELPLTLAETNDQ